MGKREMHIQFWEKSQKRPLGRPRYRLSDNMKMDQTDTGLVCMDWTDLAQDRDWWRALVNMITDLEVS
jgi:hypothetical protein